jgi:hypothetical protein
MAGVTFRLIKLMFLGLISFTLLIPQLACAEGYDITYDDPSYDVEDMFGGPIGGYEHIDIIQINSHEANFGTHLVLEITVVGLITDSEDISYSFYLMDGEEDVYNICYSDGVCTGYDYEDGSSDVLQATGSGSETLEVRIQISEVDDISDYDYYAEASEYDDVNNVYPWDRAPDEEDDWYDDDDYWYYYGVPVMITEPRPQSTVYGTRTIKGVTDYWGSDMESVEIQIDSTYSGGWQAASSYDSWETWSFEWDTTSYSDGEHTINARAYDGTEYYYDSIYVFVDQSSKSSPRTMNVPELLVGTVLEYEIDYPADIYSFYEDTIIDAEMVMAVIDIETIEVDNKEYEVYAVEMTMTLSMTLVFDDETMTIKAEMDGTQWLRVSDLATVKTDMDMTMTYSYFGMSGTENQETTSTCDPPLDTYNFPISIGETWEATSTVTTTTKTSGSIYSDSEETDVSDSNQEYEALHVEDVTVTAGTFETFVIWSGDSSDSTLGGGTSLFSSGSGYTLTYYSPEIGFPVKTESYDNNRDLQASMELISFEKGKGQDTASTSGVLQLPFYLLLIPILVIIILASVMIAKRRRREKAAGEPQAQYARTGAAIPNYQSQPNAYVPSAYTASPSQYPSQVYPIQTVSYAQPVAQQSVYYGHPRQVYAVQPFQYTPSVSPAYISRSFSPQPTRTVGYPPQLRQPQSSMVEVECPNCARVFSVPSKSAKVQCPFCKTTGRME